ncbi:hypothetical protein PSN45_004330 [Yamadazyma tenuis]|uniref:uncharacterized protein n=1 Tax=Candida tenuis TaxID=2315449 RepID=UPI00279A91B1|nr:hypothetical protein PSN45_004330 [Yamadazyma tenuis]
MATRIPVILRGLELDLDLDLESDELEEALESDVLDAFDEVVLEALDDEVVVLESSDLADLSPLFCKGV